MSHTVREVVTRANLQYSVFCMKGKTPIKTTFHRRMPIITILLRISGCKIFEPQTTAVTNAMSMSMAMTGPGVDYSVQTMT